MSVCVCLCMYVYVCVCKCVYLRVLRSVYTVRPCDINKAISFAYVCKKRMSLEPKKKSTDFCFVRNQFFFFLFISETIKNLKSLHYLLTSIILLHNKIVKCFFSCLSAGVPNTGRSYLGTLGFKPMPTLPCCSGVNTLRGLDAARSKVI